MERKSAIVICGNGITYFAIGTNTSGVGHEDSGFAFYIGAQVPGTAFWKQGHAGDIIDVVDPLVFSGFIGFKHAQTLIPHVFQTINYPVHVLFDGDEHVAQN